MATFAALIHLRSSDFADLVRMAQGEDVPGDRCDALVDASLAQRDGAATQPVPAVLVALAAMARAPRRLAITFDCGGEQGAAHVFIAEPAVLHVAAGGQVQLGLVPAAELADRLAALVRLHDRPGSVGPAVVCRFGDVRAARTAGRDVLPADAAPLTDALRSFVSSTHVMATDSEGTPVAPSIAWLDLGGGGLWTAIAVDEQVLVPTEDDFVRVTPTSRAELLSRLEGSLR